MGSSKVVIYHSIFIHIQRTQHLLEGSTYAVPSYREVIQHSLINSVTNLSDPHAGEVPTRYPYAVL